MKHIQQSDVSHTRRYAMKALSPPPTPPNHQRRTVAGGALQSASIKHEKVMKQQAKRKAQKDGPLENGASSACLSCGSDTAGGDATGAPHFQFLTDPHLTIKISKYFTFYNSFEASFPSEVCGEVNARQAFIFVDSARSSAKFNLHLASRLKLPQLLQETPGFTSLQLWCSQHHHPGLCFI